MKLNFPFRLTEALVLLVLMALAWPGKFSQALAEDAVVSRSVTPPRTSQAQELSALREEYAARARQPGVDQAKLLAEYNAKVDAIRKKFLAADTRAAEMQDIQDRYQGEIESTGSKPKDVRADVDLAARNEQAGQRLAEEWRAQGDVVTETPTKYVNQTRDATLWKPETPEISKAKVDDLDAFSTEGGQEGTGNRSRARDELGWDIDNEKKRLHAQQEGDIKTTSKSVDKAAEATGTRRFDPNAQTMVVDPETGKLVPSERVKGGFVRDGGIKTENPEFYRQAEVMRNYGDDARAGVTDLADTPEVRQQKIDAWNEKVNLEMEKTRAVAERRSAVRDTVRENLQQSLENATPADPANQAANTRDAAEIADQRTRVRESNLAGDRKNAELRQELEAARGERGPTSAADVDHLVDADTVPSTPDGKGPKSEGLRSERSPTPAADVDSLAQGDGSPTKVREGAGTSAESSGPKVETVGTGTKIRRILNTADEVMGAVGLAGQFGEAGTRQAGQAIDENRDLTAGDAGQALLDGSGVPGVYQMGRDISTEEQLRVEKGEQGQAAALGRTYVRMADKMAHEMINDPVDRAIAEEEARAAAAGEDPDYWRSTFNGFTEVGGKFTGLGALANAVEEPGTWDERADYAAQRGAMGQFVEENVGRSSTRIRKLQGEIEQLSLNGDMADPDTAAQIQQRITQMDAEYDKLERVSGMAERTLGQSAAQSVDRQIASLPSRDDFTGYIDENVTARGGKIDSIQPARAERAATAVLDTGEPAPRDLSPADQQSLANESSAASQTTLGSPQQASGGSWLDTIKQGAEQIKNEVENQVVDSVIKNPQPYVRGALQGLNAESDDSRRIRQMYNAAPEGSEDRTKLNGLFEQLRDARTPEQRAAAQAEISRWSDKYPPPAQLAPTTPNELVLPTKDDLQTARDESADRLQRQNDYIRQLEQSGGSKEDIESAQWVRDQEQQRLDGINQSLSGGEFQQPATPADGAAPASPATTVSAITPAGEGPAEIQPEPEEQRSPGGWTADQLQNDNYNMGNLAENSQDRIKNLEQQIADSHNSTEKQELQDQIDKERAELNNLQTRIDDNNAELTAMGAETGTGEKPEPSLWTADQLQNDNYNMGNLAEDSRDRIKNLEQQIAESHDGSERRDLQEQLDRERAELGGLQDRIDNNNAQLVDMGAEPGTGEKPEQSPWTADQLQNDNYNMQNLVGDAQDRIKNLEQQIADSHNSTEKQDLQDQIDKERAEINNLQDRIDGNNADLAGMGAETGTGGGQEPSDDAEEDEEAVDAAATAGSEVFGTGADFNDDESDEGPPPEEDAPSGSDDLAANEPGFNEGADGSTPPEVDPDTEGGILIFAQNNEQNLPGVNDYDIVKTSTEGQQAETANDQEVDNAGNVRNQGGAEAQQTVNQGAAEVAADDRNNSWGNVMGNAVQTGFEQGGQALGTAFAGTGADHVTGHVFGPTAPTNSSSGNAEGNENGDDAGQGDAVASGAPPSVPPPAPPPQQVAQAPVPPAAPSGGGMCPNCHIPKIKCSDGVWRCPNSGWVRQNGGAAAQTPPAAQPVVVPNPTYGPMISSVQPNLTPVQLNANNEPMFAPGQSFDNTTPVPYGGFSK